MSWQNDLAVLDIEAVVALHAELIEESGGSHGLRDEGLLESAISRAENHAFIDGNKRIGLGALAVFLKLNGYVLTCSVTEETAMVLRAAASEITEEEWTAWVVRSVGPVRGGQSF